MTFDEGLDREMSVSQLDIVECLMTPIYINKSYDPGKEYLDPLRVEAANEIKQLRAQVEQEIENWKARNRQCIEAERRYTALADSLVKLLESCKGEHLKFEEWATSEKYDMEE